MRPGEDELLVHLKQRDLLDINDGQGLAVVCIDGVVWITQSDDTRDVIISAGEAFVLDKPGLALVAAPVGPATVAVRPATHDTPTVTCDLPTAGDLRLSA